ncbi:hypothetical protein Ae201684_019131, partial [Aphanomyces euteiches]
WDDFSAHFTADVVECAKLCNVILEKLPPTFTWMCQPADVSWIKPIKTKMRHKWIDHLRTQVSTHCLDGGERWKAMPPSRADLVDWINDAWESIPRSTIINGFIKCKIIDSPLQHHMEAADDDNEAEQTATMLEGLLEKNYFDVHELDDTDDFLSPMIQTICRHPHRNRLLH